MTKRKSTRTEHESKSSKPLDQRVEKLDLIKTAESVVEKGVEHLLVLGLHGTGLMEIATSLGGYDAIHSILNRALFEINMSHAKRVIDDNKPSEKVEEKIG